MIISTRLILIFTILFTLTTTTLVLSKNFWQCDGITDGLEIPIILRFPDDGIWNGDDDYLQGIQTFINGVQDEGARTWGYKNRLKVVIGAPIDSTHCRWSGGGVAAPTGLPQTTTTTCLEQVREYDGTRWCKRSRTTRTGGETYISSAYAGRRNITTPNTQNGFEIRFCPKTPNDGKTSPTTTNTIDVIHRSAPHLTNYTYSYIETKTSYNSYPTWEFENEEIITEPRTCATEHHLGIVSIEANDINNLLITLSPTLFSPIINAVKLFYPSHWTCDQWLTARDGCFVQPGSWCGNGQLEGDREECEATGLQSLYNVGGNFWQIRPRCRFDICRFQFGYDRGYAAYLGTSISDPLPLQTNFNHWNIYHRCDAVCGETYIRIEPRCMRSVSGGGFVVLSVDETVENGNVCWNKLGRVPDPPFFRWECGSTVNCPTKPRWHCRGNDNMPWVLCDSDENNGNGGWSVEDWAEPEDFDKPPTTLLPPQSTHCSIGYKYRQRLCGLPGSVELVNFPTLGNIACGTFYDPPTQWKLDTSKPCLFLAQASWAVRPFDTVVGPQADTIWERALGDRNIGFPQEFTLPDVNTIPYEAWFNGTDSACQYWYWRQYRCARQDPHSGVVELLPYDDYSCSKFPWGYYNGFQMVSVYLRENRCRFKYECQYIGPDGLYHPTPCNDYRFVPCWDCVDTRTIMSDCTMSLSEPWYYNFDDENQNDSNDNQHEYEHDNGDLIQPGERIGIIGPFSGFCDTDRVPSSVKSCQDQNSRDGCHRTACSFDPDPVKHRDYANRVFHDCDVLLQTIKNEPMPIPIPTLPMPTPVPDLEITSYRDACQRRLETDCSGFLHYTVALGCYNGNEFNGGSCSQIGNVTSRQWDIPCDVQCESTFECSVLNPISTPILNPIDNSLDYHITPFDTLYNYTSDHGVYSAHRCYHPPNIKKDGFCGDYHFELSVRCVINGIVQSSLQPCIDNKTPFPTRTNEPAINITTINTETNTVLVKYQFKQCDYHCFDQNRLPDDPKRYLGACNPIIVTEVLAPVLPTLKCGPAAESITCQESELRIEKHCGYYNRTSKEFTPYPWSIHCLADYRNTGQAQIVPKAPFIYYFNIFVWAIPCFQFKDDTNLNQFNFDSFASPDFGLIKATEHIKQCQLRPSCQYQTDTVDIYMGTQRYRGPSLAPWPNPQYGVYHSNNCKPYQDCDKTCGSFKRNVQCAVRNDETDEEIPFGPMITQIMNNLGQFNPNRNNPSILCTEQRQVLNICPFYEDHIANCFEARCYLPLPEESYIPWGAHHTAEQCTKQSQWDHCTQRREDSCGTFNLTMGVQCFDQRGQGYGNLNLCLEYGVIPQSFIEPPVEDLWPYFGTAPEFKVECPNYRNCLLYEQICTFQSDVTKQRLALSSITTQDNVNLCPLLADTTTTDNISCDDYRFCGKASPTTYCKFLSKPQYDTFLLDYNFTNPIDTDDINNNTAALEALNNLLQNGDQTLCDLIFSKNQTHSPQQQQPLTNYYDIEHNAIVNYYDIRPKQPGIGQLPLQCENYRECSRYVCGKSTTLRQGDRFEMNRLLTTYTSSTFDRINGLYREEYCELPLQQALCNNLCGLGSVNRVVGCLRRYNVNIWGYSPQNYENENNHLSDVYFTLNYTECGLYPKQLPPVMSLPCIGSKCNYEYQCAADGSGPYHKDNCNDATLRCPETIYDKNIFEIPISSSSSNNNNTSTSTTIITLGDISTYTKQYNTRCISTMNGTYADDSFCKKQQQQQQNNNFSFGSTTSTSNNNNNNNLYNSANCSYTLPSTICQSNLDIPIDFTPNSLITLDNGKLPFEYYNSNNENNNLNNNKYLKQYQQQLSLISTTTLQNQYNNIFIQKQQGIQPLPPIGMRHYRHRNSQCTIPVITTSALLGKKIKDRPGYIPINIPNIEFDGQKEDQLRITFSYNGPQNNIFYVFLIKVNNNLKIFDDITNTISKNKNTQKPTTKEDDDNNYLRYQQDSSYYTILHDQMLFALPLNNYTTLLNINNTNNNNQQLLPYELTRYQELPYIIYTGPVGLLPVTFNFPKDLDNGKYFVGYYIDKYHYQLFAKYPIIYKANANSNNQNQNDILLRINTCKQPNGYWDYNLQQCICSNEWTGIDCTIHKCDTIQCYNGYCEINKITNQPQCNCISGYRLSNDITCSIHDKCWLLLKEQEQQEEEQLLSLTTNLQDSNNQTQLTKLPICAISSYTSTGYRRGILQPTLINEGFINNSTYNLDDYNNIQCNKCQCLGPFDPSTGCTTCDINLINCGGYGGVSDINTNCTTCICQNGDDSIRTGTNCECLIKYFDIIYYYPPEIIQLIIKYNNTLINDLEQQQQKEHQQDNENDNENQLNNFFIKELNKWKKIVLYDIAKDLELIPYEEINIYKYGTRNNEFVIIFSVKFCVPYLLQVQNDHELGLLPIQTRLNNIEKEKYQQQLLSEFYLWELNSKNNINTTTWVTYNNNDNANEDGNNNNTNANNTTNIIHNNTTNINIKKTLELQHSLKQQRLFLKLQIRLQRLKEHTQDHSPRINLLLPTFNITTLYYREYLNSFLNDNDNWDFNIMMMQFENNLFLENNNNFFDVDVDNENNNENQYYDNPANNIDNDNVNNTNHHQQDDIALLNQPHTHIKTSSLSSLSLSSKQIINNNILKQQIVDLIIPNINTRINITHLDPRLPDLSAIQTNTKQWNYTHTNIATGIAQDLMYGFKSIGNTNLYDTDKQIPILLTTSLPKSNIIKKDPLLNTNELTIIIIIIIFIILFSISIFCCCMWKYQILLFKDFIKKREEERKRRRRAIKEASSGTGTAAAGGVTTTTAPAAAAGLNSTLPITSSATGTVISTLPANHSSTIMIEMTTTTTQNNNNNNNIVGGNSNDVNSHTNTDIQQQHKTIVNNTKKNRKNNNNNTQDISATPVTIPTTTGTTIMCPPMMLQANSSLTNDDNHNFNIFPLYNDDETTLNKNTCNNNNTQLYNHLSSTNIDIVPASASGTGVGGGINNNRSSHLPPPPPIRSTMSNNNLSLQNNCSSNSNNNNNNPIQLQQQQQQQQQQTNNIHAINEYDHGYDDDDDIDDDDDDDYFDEDAEIEFNHNNNNNNNTRRTSNGDKRHSLHIGGLRKMSIAGGLPPGWTALVLEGQTIYVNEHTMQSSKIRPLSDGSLPVNKTTEEDYASGW